VAALACAAIEVDVLEAEAHFKFQGIMIEAVTGPRPNRRRLVRLNG
jgi:hypothetical protein